MNTVGNSISKHNASDKILYPVLYDPQYIYYNQYHSSTQYIYHIL